MAAIGFMTLNLNSETTYFEEISRFAQQKQIQCFRFVPSKINPITEKVAGEQFDTEKNKWIKKEFPLPEVLYDRCFYGDDAHSKQCMAIVNWLKTRKDIQFLGYGLPNKIELYEVLAASKLAPYIPKTIFITSPEQVLNTLTTLNPIIIKPINGSQGYGIYFIEKNNKEYIVRTDKKEKQVSHTFTNEVKFSTWLSSLLKKRDFLLQPFLLLSNKWDQPYDIRSLLQKNEHGDWKVIGKGIRTGKKGGILSNLAAGADVITFETWINSSQLHSKDYLCEELEYILTNIPSVLEENFLPLFELGVDIGIAKDGTIWILDINSKPGRKVILQTNPDIKALLSAAPILYANTLLKPDIHERSFKHHEKTLSD